MSIYLAYDNHSHVGVIGARLCPNILQYPLGQSLMIFGSTAANLTVDFFQLGVLAKDTIFWNTWKWNSLVVGIPKCFKTLPVATAYCACSLPSSRLVSRPKCVPPSSAARSSADNAKGSGEAQRRKHR